MKRNRFIYVVLLIALLCSSVIWEQMIFLFLAAAMLATTAVSGIYNLFILSQLTGEIKIPPTANKRQSVQGDIILVHEGRAFLPEIICRIQITNLLTGEIFEEQCQTTPGWFQQIELPFVMRSKYCGCLEITIAFLEIYDFWKVLTLRKKWKQTSYIHVMPDTFRQEITLAGSYQENMLLGERMGETPGAVLGELFDFKEYEKGDSVKNIHWKLTGKYDKPMLKRMTKEVDNTILLLFETGYQKQGKATAEIRDAMAEIFVSLSQNLMNKGISHKIGWKKQPDGNLLFYDIKNEADIVGILPKILAVTYQQTEETVMDCLCKQYRQEIFSHFICVTSEEQQKDVRKEIAERTRVTFLVGTEGESQMLSGGRVISIHWNPKEYREQLHSIEI